MGYTWRNIHASKNIKLHSCALPPKIQGEETAEMQAVQGKLNSFVVSKWFKEGLLEHIIEFIVTNDQVFLSLSFLSSHLSKCSLSLLLKIHLSAVY
jgi:hypothetical protein